MRPPNTPKARKSQKKPRELKNQNGKTKSVKQHAASPSIMTIQINIQYILAALLFVLGQSLSLESISQSPSAEPPLAPAHDQVLQQLQAQALESSHSSQAIWLELESEEVKPGKILARYTPDQSGTPLGALLLIHPQGSLPAIQSLDQDLESYLSRHGWSVLSLPIPAGILQRTTENPSTPNTNAQKLADGASDKAIDSTDNKFVINPKADMPNELPSVIDANVKAHIDAGMAALAKENPLTVFIAGYGLGAQFSCEYLTAQGTNSTTPSGQKIMGALLINAQTGYLAQEVLDISNLKLPILDIYHRDYPQAQTLAQGRHQSALKAQLPAYRQSSFIKYDSIFVQKKVRGFLEGVLKPGPAAIAAQAY